jgi:predicted small secreted protein
MMKKTLTYLAAALAITGILTASCGRNTAGAGHKITSDTTGTAFIKFSETEHDFGKVKSGERVGCFFTYENTGDADLVVASASASCGCTVPKYDRKPVPPGGKGTLEVVFDTSGREGLQTKTVVVQSNAENNLVILRIIAEVVNDREGSRQ